MQAEIIGAENLQENIKIKNINSYTNVFSEPNESGFQYPYQNTYSF